MPFQTRPSDPRGVLIRELPTTRWTRIVAAQKDSEERRRVCGEIFSLYWRPLVVFARRRGLSVEDASDAVQGFAATVIEGNLLERADPTKGRLRSYLVRGFSNFLSDMRAARGALKRGGGSAHVPIDAAAVEGSLGRWPSDPIEAFETAWAERLFAEALEALRREYADGARAGDVEVLIRYLGGAPLPPLRELAEASGTTVSQWKAFLHRGRERLRALVEAGVRETVGAEEDVQDEMRRVYERLSA